MTTATYSTDRTAWDAAVHHLAGREAAQPDATGEAAEEAAYDNWADAWMALMRMPAPDIAAVAFKLEIMIKRQFATKIGDDVRDSVFLQRLMDAPHLFEGEEHVLLLQDAARLCGMDHPAVGLAPAVSKPWPEMTAAYRAGVAAHLKLHDGPDEADDFEVQASHSRLRPLHTAILNHTPADANELAEKAELLLLDTDDQEDNVKELKALAADARRIAEAVQ